jgi:hypothetical protein
MVSVAPPVSAQFTSTPGPFESNHTFAALALEIREPQHIDRRIECNGRARIEVNDSHGESSW